MMSPAAQLKVALTAVAKLPLVVLTVEDLLAILKAKEISELHPPVWNDECERWVARLREITLRAASRKDL